MQLPQNMRVIAENSGTVDIHFESVTDKKIKHVFPAKKMERGNNKNKDAFENLPQVICNSGLRIKKFPGCTFIISLFLYHAEMSTTREANKTFK